MKMPIVYKSWRSLKNERWGSATPAENTTTPTAHTLSVLCSQNIKISASERYSGWPESKYSEITTKA